MVVLGPLIFALFFLWLMPKFRIPVLAALGSSANWMGKYAPFSYILLAIIVAAAIAALVLMVMWPAAPEPENPLAKYKRSDLDVVE